VGGDVVDEQEVLLHGPGPPPQVGLVLAARRARRRSSKPPPMPMSMLIKTAVAADAAGCCGELGNKAGLLVGRGRSVRRLLPLNLCSGEWRPELRIGDRERRGREGAVFIGDRRRGEEGGETCGVGPGTQLSSYACC
jgi:hypothetical protein